MSRKRSVFSFIFTAPNRIRAAPIFSVRLVNRSCQQLVLPPTTVPRESIRRYPEGEHYDKDLVRSVIGLPWNLKPPEVGRQGKVEKKFYITKSDLALYGRTEGCPACEATYAVSTQSSMQGKASRGKNQKGIQSESEWLKWH